jgi:hypothetical protein
MFKILLFSFIFIIHEFELNAQSNWVIYLGANHSNVIHSINGQSILYAHTLNAPLWNFGFQCGIDSDRHINTNLDWSIGLRIQLKGDKKSIQEIAPQSEYHSLRFLDLMMPINLKYRILNSKEIFLKWGLSGNYLIFQNKEEYFALYPISSSSNKFGLSGQIGFNFIISSRIGGEFMYSEGFTKIYKIPVPPGTYYPTGSSLSWRHQAFEFTLFYKL